MIYFRRFMAWHRLTIGAMNGRSGRQHYEIKPDDEYKLALLNYSWVFDSITGTFKFN